MKQKNYFSIVRATLLVLLALLLVPKQIMAQDSETTTYDFAQLAQNARNAAGSGNLFPINMQGSYSGITGGQYGASTTYGNLTLDLSRFAFRNNNQDRGWDLQYLGDDNKGLYWHYATPEFAIVNLSQNDEVTVYFRSNGNRIATMQFVSGSATLNNSALSANSQLGTVNNGSSSFTMKATAKGDIIIKASTNPGTAFITKIVVKHYAPTPLNRYNYDYSKETYDLTNKTWNIGTGESAGFNYRNGGGEAKYITNPNNYELNNRIAISSTISNFGNSNGLKNNAGGVRIVSIMNLHEGDRVKITYTGTVSFRSSHTDATIFEAENRVFYDSQNDGEIDTEDDQLITGGTVVQNNAVYTMLFDTRLDIGLNKYAIIQKIEIISDRTCDFIYTKNADGSTTLSFDGTGQLLSKSANVGSLIVEFSNAQKSNEAVHVTASDHGYKSVCEDPEGFKMARRSDTGTGTAQRCLLRGPGSDLF